MMPLRRLPHINSETLKAALLFSLPLVSVTFLLSACPSSIEIEEARAMKAMEAGRLEQALDHFDRILLLDPDGPQAIRVATEGARIAHLDMQDHHRALRYHRHLVIHASEEKQRWASQKAIAEISFEHLSDYQQSILEFHRLLEASPTPDEEVQFRTALARSYFHLNNFFQSKSEVRRLLELELSEERRFQVRLLKANIYLAEENTEKAIERLQQLMEKDIDLAIQENVPVTLAISLEEKRQFAEAIEILESVVDRSPHPEFLELRIRRLRERLANQPGVGGLRR